MTVWRFGRGWNKQELQMHLQKLESIGYNYSVPWEEMTLEHGWLVDGSDAHVHSEPPGPPVPGGVFDTAKNALLRYNFSHPFIVTGHFDRSAPLVGRNMLLEIKVFGFRFLNGVRVHSVKDYTQDNVTVFGFRYDTLEGHIEEGYEWFLLTKNHLTGEVRFKIEAHWRPGQFPNWWMKVGFFIMGSFFRSLWRHLAPSRLRIVSDTM